MALGTPDSRRTIRRQLRRLKLGRRAARKKKSMGQHPDRNAQPANCAATASRRGGSSTAARPIRTPSACSFCVTAAAATAPPSISSRKTCNGWRIDVAAFPAARGHVIHSTRHFDPKRSSHARLPYRPKVQSQDLTPTPAPKKEIDGPTSRPQRPTSELCCDSVASWWEQHGRAAYPHAERLLILCDGGGSNSATQYLFKEDLQRLANRRRGFPSRAWSRDTLHSPFRSEAVEPCPATLPAESSKSRPDPNSCPLGRPCSRPLIPMDTTVWAQRAMSSARVWTPSML